jgi:F-type H+-transporting ATPase subunit delta
MGLIARRYAKAILDFAESRNESDLVLTQLKQLRESFKQVPELTNLMENPTVSEKTKKGILIQASGKNAGSVLEESIDLLIENKRLQDILWIAIQYNELYNLKNNIHEVVLTTSTGLDSPTEKSLINWIEREVQGKVELTRVKDEKILGGFILDVDCNRWDASLSTSLSDLKKNLIS